MDGERRADQFDISQVSDGLPGSGVLTDFAV